MAQAAEKTPQARAGRTDQRKQRREEHRNIMEGLTARWKVEIEAYGRLPEQGRFDRDEWKEQWKKQKERTELEFDEIQRMSLGITLPVDPAALLDGMSPHGLTEEDAKRFPATVAAWMRKDPDAALRFLSTLQPEKAGAFSNGLQAWIKYTDVDTALAALELQPKVLTSYGVLAINRAVTQDPSKLGSLLEKMEGKLDRSAILRGAFNDLPESSRGAALEWIRGNLKGREAGDAVMQAAISLSRTDDAAAKALLTEAIRHDPELPALLKGWGNYSQIMGSGVGKDSPMQDRIAAALQTNLQGKTDEEKRQNAIRLVTSQDTREWFQDGGWGEDLRNGSATAGEAWEAAAEELPHLAAADRGALLESVFAEISMIDPKAALDLIRQQGDAGKLAEHVRRTVERNGFNKVEQAVKLAAYLPDDVVRPQLGAYDRTYRTLVSMNAERGGPFWTDWVKDQPEGLSRDLLLHYTARAYFRKGNEAQGNALKAMVRDSTVKSWPKL
jgi:hypothetical protein